MSSFLCKEMIAYQVGCLKYPLCTTPVWWEGEAFFFQWKSEPGLWLWGAEGGLYFPEKSHYYCPANLWPASVGNLPAESLSFLLPPYALLISLWSHHPLCATAITQRSWTQRVQCKAGDWARVVPSTVVYSAVLRGLVKGNLWQHEVQYQQRAPPPPRWLNTTRRSLQGQVWQTKENEKNQTDHQM